MTITVEVQGRGKVAEFPDGTDPSVIDRAIKRDFFSKVGTPPPPHQMVVAQPYIKPIEEVKDQEVFPSLSDYPKRLLGSFLRAWAVPQQAVLRYAKKRAEEPEGSEISQIGQSLKESIEGFSGVRPEQEFPENFPTPLKYTLDPILAAGITSVGRGIIKGLTAKAMEKTIPVSRTVGNIIKAGEIPIVPGARSITEIAKEALLPKVRPKSLEAAAEEIPSKQAELLKLARESQVGTPPPTPRFLKSAEELLNERAAAIEEPITLYRGQGTEQSKYPTFVTADRKYAEQYSKDIVTVQLKGDEKIADLTAGSPRLETRLKELGLSEDEVLEVMSKQGKEFNASLGDTLRKKGYDIIKSSDEYQLLYPSKYKSKSLTEPTPTAQPSATPLPEPSPISSKTALTDDEWRFLKEGSEPSIRSKRTILQKGKELARGAMFELNPPYEVFSREPTGIGVDLWKVSEQFERYKNVFLQKQFTDFRKMVPFGPGSRESLLIGEMLDKFQTWDEVVKGAPPEIKKFITPEIKNAFIHIRSNWDHLWDDLVARGLAKPQRKIGAYLFHMFDKDTIVQAWKDELSILIKNGGDKGRIDKLQRALDNYNKSGSLLYDVLPQNLNIPFLQARKGAPGYSMDAVRAYSEWLKFYGKKSYTEPVLKVGMMAMEKMSPEFRRYTKDYLKRYAGIDQANRLKDIERALTSLTYVNALGWNTRSALVNATQHLNTIVELGPKGPTYLLKAIRFSRTPEGKTLWDASGHAAEVPELRWGLVEQHVEKILGSSFKLFDKVELGNRKMAFFGGYLKALDQGMTGKLATDFADNVLRKTQFLYGKVGAPLLMSKTGGKVAMQFTSFSINQLNLMHHWAKENPGKLIAYLVTASAMQEGLQTLGIDLSNALGVGMDIDEMTHALGHIGRWEGKAAWAHTKVALPKTPFLPFVGSGSGIFPSGIAPSIDYLSNLIHGEWAKMMPPAVERVYTAGRAIAEGPLPREGGYAVRTPGEETLRHRETLPQLLSRTFLAKPMVETEASKEFSREKMFKESYQSQMQKISKLVVDGKLKEARELVKVYGSPTSQMIRAERDRRRLTSGERRKRMAPPSGAVGRYKRRLGEKPPISELRAPPTQPPQIRELEVGGQ